MEGLTKQQIVLVALLISFVTSIATGIVTVALMDQAPPGVTQTINRIVERTIEKVVPSPNQTASVVTKETVVVKEDDLVVQAIEKNTKSLVSIIQTVGEGEAKVETFIGNGIFVSKEGLIATDRTVVDPVLDENSNPVIQSLKAVISNGDILPITIVSTDNSSGIVFLKPIVDEKIKKETFTPVTLADAISLKLGQTVIAIGGEKISVATGIVSNISHNTVASSTDAVAVSNGSIIKTSVAVPGKTLGGILVNLSGDVVGIRALTAGNSDTAFLPSGLISKNLPK